MNSGYTREIVVLTTPDAAYQALTTGFDKWWTRHCHPIYKIGDQITFRFGPTYWVLEATNLVPGAVVELECIEAHHVHEGLPSSILHEWENTKLQWTIQKQGKNTKIVFLHKGLLPALNCYEVCEKGWDYFFNHSLKHYLDSGEGFPFDKEV